MSDLRFTQDTGIQAYTGTELLFKGALEAGVSLMTGYPGSPIADFFELPEARRKILQEHGIVLQMANNEALGAARINGTQMGDLRAMAVMKSVGLHVASDALAIGNLSKTGHQGGALIVIGDDPWNESTQVPADSRFLSQHLFMPVLAPGTFQELKDWVRLAFELSRTADLFIGYLVTTTHADGGGTVQVHPNLLPAITTKTPYAIETAELNLDASVMLPPRTGQRETDLVGRFDALLATARAFGINRIEGPAQEVKHPLGFVVSGIAATYLDEALGILGLRDHCLVLRLGLCYPVDRTLVVEFAKRVGELCVVEEKRAFLETQLALLLKDAWQHEELPRMPKVWGKHFPKGLTGLPEAGGLNTSILIERLVPFINRLNGHLTLHAERLAEEERCVRETAQVNIHVPARSPTFCPGCPHRDTGSVLLDLKRDLKDPAYMLRRYHRAPVDLLFHGDTGCYTMFMFEPYPVLMHNYSGMGLGGGTGAGIDPFITNKQIVFMGDGTFFHSGMIAISDSLKHSQDITYLILDNKTTAMTGHQPTAGNDTDIMGNPTFAQDIEAIVRGMSAGRPIAIHRISPADREAYRTLVEDLVLREGVKVIIADKECGITFHRRARHDRQILERKLGFLPVERHMNITPEVCEYCLECTKATGCPALAVIDTPYGPKIATDHSTCVTDTACAKRLVCPSFEEVIIHRKRPAARTPDLTTSHLLPQPPRQSLQGPWGAYLAGVGGMGIGTVTAILVRAGMDQGYHVRFSERKGLAIRNGGVFATVILTQDRTHESPVIPYGKADLLLGMDILEAARGLDPSHHFRVAHPARTAAVLNTGKVSTVSNLMGKTDFDPAVLAQAIRRYTRQDAVVEWDFAQVAERELGNKIYANLLMLGAAYQRGFLPLDLERLTRAIEQTIRVSDREANVRAFHLGRELIVHPDRFAVPSAYPAVPEPVIGEKRRVLARHSKRWAEAYEFLIVTALGQMPGLRPEVQMHLALRTYDAFQFDGPKCAGRYLETVQAVYRRDHATRGYAATEAVVHNLHKVTCIKDEIYVAHLLTSDEKLARDKVRYEIDEANGDRIEYRHLNRPSFPILGWQITFDWKARNWQLRLMRRMRWLRHLPGWHAEEQAFRDWYEGIVDRATLEPASAYETYLELLKLPEEVRGYREIRAPQMLAARLRAAELLKNLGRLRTTRPRPTLSRVGV